MPWHVLVDHQKPSPDELWPLVDRVFRADDYPDSESLVEAVNQVEQDLRARYPAPDYTVVSGKGPESTSAEFHAFVLWLLRDE
jgi:hypothetical protein